MTWGASLSEEITGEFAGLAGIFEATEEFHLHETLNNCKAGHRELLTDAQRRERRAALETRRRVYKTLKQREYDRRPTCLGCAGVLGKTHNKIAKCSGCGAENYVDV